jgi:transcriptional regulator with XRE-family HTH domain
MTFEERLAHVVRRIGSNRKAAAVAGVVDNQIGKYLAGQAKPSFQAIARLCQATNISLDWLATGRGPEQPGALAAPLDDLRIALAATILGIRPEALRGTLVGTGPSIMPSEPSP